MGTGFRIRSCAKALLRWEDADKGTPRPSQSHLASAIFGMTESQLRRGAALHRWINMAEPKKQAVQRDLAAGGIAARALRTRGEAYLGELNPEQRAAVETLDGPVLVLAGAGTGKTRVLTTRIAHILNLGRARPAEILAVTFTNKAAREMKLRIGTMVGQIVEGMPWLGTFHAIGVKILRRHAERSG